MTEARARKGWATGEGREKDDRADRKVAIQEVALGVLFTTDNAVDTRSYGNGESKSAMRTIFESSRACDHQPELQCGR